jgi:hypothetical protein
MFPDRPAASLEPPDEYVGDAQGCDDQARDTDEQLPGESCEEPGVHRVLELHDDVADAAAPGHL